VTDRDHAFTLAGYRDLLEAFGGRGYRTVDFHTARPGARQLIVRHDVDVSLESACRMAEVERDLSVSATYLVLVRSEFYNPFSAAAERHLRRLVELGHEIGLHLDASLYGDAWGDLEAAGARECALLEAVVGAPVRIVSFHRPAQRLVGLDRTLAGRHHAYQPRFATEIGYCSDSRGGWRHGRPLDHPAVAEGRALQLLTHPVWWDAFAGEGVVDRLNRFALGRLDALREELGRHCEPYRDGLRPPSSPP
jgi:hypothetical protein